MKIIEKLISSKTGDAKTCEDRMFYNENFAAVVDGATNKSELLFDGKSPGMIASNIVCDEIAKFHPRIDFTAAVEKLTKSIYKFYIDNGFEFQVKQDPTMTICATAAIFSRFRKEVWLIGECQCIANGILYSNNNLVSKINAEARALYLEEEIASGKNIQELINHDTGREFIMPLLRRQYLFENAKDDVIYSYPVLNGFSVNPKNIVVIAIQKDQRHLILASDGYPLLKSTLADSEKHLKDLLVDDPLCFRIFKSTKGCGKGNISFDDRTYLKIAI